MRACPFPPMKSRAVPFEDSTVPRRPRIPMPAGGANSARPLFRASADCFLMRPCLRGALYNTHNMPCLRRTFQSRLPLPEIAKMRASSKSNFVFPKPDSTIRQNAIPPFGKFAVRKIVSFKYESAPFFGARKSAPKPPQKKRADIRRAPEKENRTIPYLEFSESPAPSDSPPSPCAPLPSASSSSTSGMV